MLTLAIAAGSTIYATGWLLTARSVYRRLLRRNETTWKQHAAAVRAGRPGHHSCTEHRCVWTYHLGPYINPAFIPAVAMLAALPWPLTALGAGLVKAVTWQRPTPETPAQAAARIERELQAEFGNKE